MFGEQRTGVLFGKLIEGQDPTPNELDNNFVSAIHKTTLDLNHFYSFLKEEVNLEEINSMKGSVAYEFHQQHLKTIISGTNIWDGQDCEESATIRIIVLTKYGANLSTQHNNERLVKISSRMTTSGKNEQNANYYLIAANGFLRKEYQTEEEQVDISVRKSKGGLEGIQKLINIQRHPGLLEDQYNMIKNTTSAEEFKTEELFVSTNLLCDGNSVETMMSSFEETKTNARIRQSRSGYVLLLFNGYILYSKLINAKYLKKGEGRIKLEFEARGILSKFDPIVQSKVSVVTKLMNL